MTTKKTNVKINMFLVYMLWKFLLCVRLLQIDTSYINFIVVYRCMYPERLMILNHCK